MCLPGKSHGWRSLVGCSPCGCEESDTNERLHFHFWLSCIGEGNGNPVQSSCLENPRDGGAWWAAVSGVAQSRTRLKRLCSSSSSSCCTWSIFLFAWFMFFFFFCMTDTVSLKYIFNLWESPFLTLWSVKNASFLAGPMRALEAVCTSEAYYYY